MSAWLTPGLAKTANEALCHAQLWHLASKTPHCYVAGAGTGAGA